jgi:hypothetical protein
MIPTLFSGATGAAGFGGFPPCLASLDFSFSQVGMMTVVVIMLIPAAVGIRSMVVTQKHEIANKPLGVEVKQAPTFITDREIDLWQQALDQRVTAIEKRQAEFDQKLGTEVYGIREDIGALHDRITNSMNSLNDKIAAVPSQIIDLLNATRKLNR